MSAMSGGWFACSSGVKSRACSLPKPVLPPLTQLRAAAASAVVLAADSRRLRSMAVRTLISVLQSP